MFCNACGNENTDDAKFCKNCGAPLLNEPPIQPFSDPVAGYESTDQTESINPPTPDTNQDIPHMNAVPPVSPVPTTHTPQTERNTNTIVCLILGIASIVCCCSSLIGVGVGIAAIVLSSQEKKKGNTDPMLTAGMICGIVGIVLGVIAMIVAFATGTYAGILENRGYRDIDDLFKFRNDYGYDAFDGM